MLHELEDEYPNEPVYRSDLLDAYAGFRHHDLPREELAEARKRLERALVYGERLVRGYPNELKYVSALTHVHFKLASVIERMARDGVAADATADLARQHYVRAVTLQRGLVERFPDGMTFRVWLALVRQQFGFFLGRNEESAKATLELQASVDELEQFLVGREEEVGACGVLARSHRWLAEAYTKAEAKDLAATAREKGDRYRDALHRLHRGDRKRNRREAVD